MSFSVREVIGVAIVVLLLAVWLAGGPDRLLAYAEGDGGCSGANRIPAPGELKQARTATLCLLNRERAERGLPPLIEDARLTRASQLHSDDMGERDFYAHETPDGVGPSVRVYAQGLSDDATTVAENIHWNTGHRATPKQIVRDWMDSPGHRENILRTEVTHVGVGIGFDAPEPGRRGRSRVYTTDFFGG
ncbi:MAG: CAP domain-containing protein [Solirubrobacteraceae bacterium]